MGDAAAAVQEGPHPALRVALREELRADAAASAGARMDHRRIAVGLVMSVINGSTDIRNAQCGLEIRNH